MRQYIITGFLSFLELIFLKKNRFLLIALIISILLHLLVFIFAPELKSEINSNDYLKKITKISIFQEVVKPESAPAVPEIPKSRNNGRKRARATVAESGKHGNNSVPADPEITESPVPAENGSAAQNIGISESRDIDKESAPVNNEITESLNSSGNDSAPRNNGGSASGDTGNTESMNPGKNSAPKKAGELAFIPKALNPKTPPYPENLEEEGIEGSVTLELLISKEGKVLKAKVIKSDHELFSESALRTVKNYKFSAGKLKDGSAVDSLIEFVIKFEISL